MNINFDNCTVENIQEFIDRACEVSGAKSDTTTTYDAHLKQSKVVARFNNGLEARFHLNSLNHLMVITDNDGYLSYIWEDAFKSPDYFAGRMNLGRHNAVFTTSHSWN